MLLKITTDLRKLATYLRQASLPPFEYYSSYGWITPHGILEGTPGGDHLTVLWEHEQLLNAKIPNSKIYQPAFQQGWVRWFVDVKRNEIGFEATRKGFTEQHSEIQKKIDQNPDKKVFIELVDDDQELIEQYKFEIPSKAEKAFQRGGIPGLERFNQSKSTLREFL